MASLFLFSFPFISFPLLSYPLVLLPLLFLFRFHFSPFASSPPSFYFPCITSLFSSFPLASFRSFLLFSTPVLCLVFIWTTFQEFLLHFCRCKKVWWLTLTHLCIVASNSHRCSTEDLYLPISLLVMVIKNIPSLALVKSLISNDFRQFPWQLASTG